MIMRAINLRQIHQAHRRVACHTNSNHSLGPGNRTYHSESNSESQRSSRTKVYFGVFALAGLATTSAFSHKKIFALSRDATKEDNLKGPRVFRRADVARHDSLENGVWISYKGKVYDITDFIQHHPGGSHTIMMGAGGDVGPFWQTYTFHGEAEVQNLLSKYLIGDLHPDDIPSSDTQQASDENSPYSNDPKRNPLLKVHTTQPFNAETPSNLLVATKYTPTDIFFVRNHLPVPEVDLQDYSLSLCVGTDGDLDGLKQIAELTLDDLKTKFKPCTIDCVIQCSGNRRSDLKKIKEIKGLDWGVGAMGNATWTGVRLADLLKHLSVQVGEDVKYVQLEGLDCDMSGQAYRASIGIDVALDPNRDVILAYEMNGKPLTRDHGFPLRFVAPGVTGARNVKWLSRIILSHEESHGHWQKKDYKSFSPNVDMFNLDYSQAASIQEMPVQSAICDPIDGSKLSIKCNKESPGKTSLPVWGYAYSGGGKMIVRVDISTDNGETWQTATLTDLPKLADGSPNYTNRNKVGSWMRWSADLALPESLISQGGGSLQILCRAFDSAYNSQPERASTVWNVRGVVNNSWHRVTLDLELK